MARRCILAMMLFLKTFQLFSQETDNGVDSIAWDMCLQLKWSDFLGKPEASSKWVAVCPASIYITGFMDKGLPNFRVTNSFLKKEAWTKDTTSAIILQHEQLHFHIAEVYSRKIRKAIDSLRIRDVKTIDTYSREITTLLKMRNKTDSLYDEQTNHGIYGDEQSAWCRKILEALKNLDDFALKPKP